MCSRPILKQIMHALVLVSGVVVFTSAAQADGHGHSRDRDSHGRDFGGHGRAGGDWGASGGHHGHFINGGHVLDGRHHHDRFYPAPGMAVHGLAPGHHVIAHGRDRFFFGGGIWYRHVHDRFVVVLPPFGLVVPFLPPFATTVWWGGAPYYYANNVYYSPGPEGYTVVQGPPMVNELPQSISTEVPSAGTGNVNELGPVNAAPTTVAQGRAPQLFVYPRQGQSADVQARDRAECNEWALGQPGVTDPADTNYLRALNACLDGRGYTVK